MGEPTGIGPRQDNRERTPHQQRVRAAKIRTLAALRLVRWATAPAEFPAPALAPPPEAFPALVYAREIPLGRPGAAFHARLEEGKRRNLALLAPAFDGLLVAPGRPLSFWRAAGRLVPARGFTVGASFEDGCVVPAVGGGACLLSNALFAMAASLGWRILERHGHTLDTAPGAALEGARGMRPAGADEPWGLDATVFWPYVDLRIAPREGPARLEVQLRGDALRLRVRAASPLRGRFVLESVGERVYTEGDEQVHENRIRRIDLAPGGAPGGEVIAVNRKRVRPGVVAGRSCLDCGEAQCPVGRRARAEAG